MGATQTGPLPETISASKKTSQKMIVLLGPLINSMLEAAYVTKNSVVTNNSHVYPQRRQRDGMLTAKQFHSTVVVYQTPQMQSLEKFPCFCNAGKRSTPNVRQKLRAKLLDSVTEVSVVTTMKKRVACGNHILNHMYAFFRTKMIGLVKSIKLVHLTLKVSGAMMAW